MGFLERQIESPLRIPRAGFPLPWEKSGLEFVPGRALSAARLLRRNGRGDVDRATLAFCNRRDGLGCRSLHGIITMAVFETLSMEEDPEVSKPGTTVVAQGNGGRGLAYSSPNRLSDSALKPSAK